MKRKFTEEEKQKIISVLSDLLVIEDMPEEPTEFDVLMKQKKEEFISMQINLNEGDSPEEMEEFLKNCDDYIKNKESSNIGFGLGIIMVYDMWLNESCTWPTCPNPKWEEWEKLKYKKAKL